MRLVHVLRMPALALAVTFTATVAHAQTVEILRGDLDNPRGLALAPNGDLYIAEAGEAGTLCGPGPTGPRCYGTTGRISRLDLRRGTYHVVASNLPSLAAPDGTAATGVHDLDFQGQGNLYFTLGWGGDPDNRIDDFGAGAARFAHLGRMLPTGSVRLVTDLGDYEVAENPDGDLPDSNPYGVLALPGRQIVVDAGANSLLEVRANGDVRTLAVFPERLVNGISMDAVPTGLALGPDGAYYVGQLTGFPFPVTGANVYRVDPITLEVDVFASGFTNIIDLAFAPDGTLYVLQISEPFGNFANGGLYRVEADGTSTRLNVALFAPGGLAIDRNGTIYVTNNSILPNVGQVLRIVP